MVFLRIGAYGSQEPDWNYVNLRTYFSKPGTVLNFTM